MLQRLELGFRFHSIDLASPLSEPLNLCLAQQFTGTAASRRLQTGSLPVAALLKNVRTQEISLNVT